MSLSVKDLADDIASKPLAEPGMRAHFHDGGFVLDGELLPLARMTARDLATRDAAATFAFLGEAPHWIAGAPDLLSPSPSIDHSPNQTPVKNQRDRLTCASFATVAAMEAILLAQGPETILSEQYACYVANGDECLDAAEIDVMAAALAQRPICVEALCQYQDRFAASRNCKQPPSPAAIQQAKYSIGSHQDIPNLGLAAPSVANTDYLESLLFQGNDIVVEIEAAIDLAGTGIQDVVLDPLNGGPLRTGRKHALLIVGYDRQGAPPYFISKNSYGTSLGHSGYYWFSYAYMATYAIRGVIVGSVQTH